jgi:hypothetical protein
MKFPCSSHRDLWLNPLQRHPEKSCRKVFPARLRKAFRQCRGYNEVLQSRGVTSFSKVLASAKGYYELARQRPFPLY